MGCARYRGVVSEANADFFISYTGTDVKWAEWIAWQLEHADFKVMIQAWDFRPGNNFVVEMNRAATQARRTILVVSPAALSSEFVRSEWSAAFAQDPTGIDRKLIPVRVEDCDIYGLLGPVVYVDLVGRDDEDAKRTLISGLEPGRSKPTTAPDFPGVSTSPLPPPSKRAPEDVGWKPFDRPLAHIKLDDLDPRASARHLTIVEVHLVPVAPELVPVSRLSTLQADLADVGRAGGMFSATSALEAVTTAEHAAIRVRDRGDDDCGLVITRAGQRGAWLALPRDGLGSVLDEQELASRLAGAIRILTKVDLTLATRYAPIAAVGPLMMLTVGDASVVGRRNSASMRASGPASIETPIEDSVLGSALAYGASEIASELVARLLARL